VHDGHRVVRVVAGDEFALGVPEADGFGEHDRDGHARIEPAVGASDGADRDGARREGAAR
jgi:hypothetical protein